MIVMVHGVVGSAVMMTEIGTGMKVAGVVAHLVEDYLQGTGMTVVMIVAMTVVMTEAQHVMNLPELMKGVAGDLLHHQGVMTVLLLLVMIDHQCVVEMIVVLVMTVDHHQQETVVGEVAVLGELGVQKMHHQDLRRSPPKMAGRPLKSVKYYPVQHFIILYRLLEG